MTVRPRTSVAVIALALIAMTAASAHAAWPGADGPIVFRAYYSRGGEANNEYRGIWSSRPGAPFTRIRQLKTKPGDMDPQVSPDGRLIVFSRHAVNGPAIYRMRSDGSRLVQLTTGISHADTEPTFARSGKRVLFSRRPISGGGSHGDIYSIRLDGSGLHRITSGPADDRDPAFSPNGRVVAFERIASGERSRVITMRPNGSRQRNLTPALPRTTHAFDPDFRPDGRRIAFAIGIRTFGGTLYTARPNGRSLRRLSPFGDARNGLFEDPAYSPSGRWLIAARTTIYGTSELYVLDARTGRRPNRILLHQGGRQIETPVWAPRPRR